MAHQVMWSQVCFTNADGEDKYIKRGNDAPDWVDDFTLFALTSAGALQVVDRGDAERAPESAPKPVETAPLPDGPDELTRPSADDPKSAWVDYASDERNPNRITRDQANGLTKSALMERFK